MKNHTPLQALPYGSIIEYQKRKFVKCQGQDGDIMMALKESGHWLGIEGTSPEKSGFFHTNWKSFKILFIPKFS